MMRITWHRREAGSYIATLGNRSATRLAIVNIVGSGPRAPRYQGLTRIWHVRKGGHGDYDLGSTTVHEAETLAAAKQWVSDHYDALS